MNTLIDIFNTDDISLEKLTKYADMLKRGELVVFPTETVYGLGANCMDAAAVEKIFKVKNRPANNPLIAHICDISMLDMVAREVDDGLLPLFNAFWPGALTVVLPKKKRKQGVACLVSLFFISLKHRF